MYTHFAAVYDRLMGDIPYDEFARLLHEAVNKTGHHVDVIVDLGCGTGAMFEVELALARQVIGIDPSLSMLAVAKEQAQRYGRRITLLEGRAESFFTPKRADLCLATCDVFNYILTPQRLQHSFAHVHDMMTPGGYFLFDMHSPRKVLQGLGDNVYYDASGETVALIETKVDQASITVAYELLLFLLEKDGRYQRVQESHQQRAYELDVILEGLEKAGFTEVYIGADFHFPWEQLEAESASIWLGDRLHVRVAPSATTMQQAMRWFFLVR